MSFGKSVIAAGHAGQVLARFLDDEGGDLEGWRELSYANNVDWCEHPEGIPHEVLIVDHGHTEVEPGSPTASATFL